MGASRLVGTCCRATVNMPFDASTPTRRPRPPVSRAAAMMAKPVPVPASSTSAPSGRLAESDEVLRASPVPIVLVVARRPRIEGFGYTIHRGDGSSADQLTSSVIGVSSGDASAVFTRKR
jgi:hypothetical protein